MTEVRAGSGDDRGHPAGSRWLTAAAWLAGVAVALPFWVGRFVPLMDLPQHLALATVIHHASDPEWGFARYFEVQWGELTPYWATYLALHLLGYLMPIETAMRVYLSLYALALPWAGMTLCRAFGRPARLGLMAAPLALNTNLYYGFVNYSVAVVLLLFAVADLERQLRAPRPGRGWRLAALTVAIFFAHVQVLALLLLCAALLAATQRAGFRAKAAALFPLAPAVLGLLLPWAYTTFVSPRGTQRQFASIHGSADPRFEPLAGSLAELPYAVAGAFQDGSDLYLLLAWAVLLAAGRAGRRPAEGDRGRSGLRPAMLALTTLACYFLAPLSIKGQWNISPRFALPAALLAIPAIGAAGGSALGWSAAAVGLSMAMGANASLHHARFDREVGPFEEALAAIPRGQRVLCLVYDQRGRVLEKWPYLHFGQYYMARRGGAVAASFAASAPIPVRYRDVRSFPHPGVWTARDFDPEIHAPPYDYVLARRPLDEPVEPLAIDRTAALEPVLSAGPWAVYRRVSPRAGDTAAGPAGRRAEAGPSRGFRLGPAGAS